MYPIMNYRKYITSAATKLSLFIQASIIWVGHVRDMRNVYEVLIGIAEWKILWGNLGIGLGG
jgi:hypothetical protein